MGGGYEKVIVREEGESRVRGKVDSRRRSGRNRVREDGGSRVRRGIGERGEGGEKKGEMKERTYREETGERQYDWR